MGLIAPSGRVLEDTDIQLVKELGNVGFIQYRERPFTLKSGVQSHVYVFGREDLTGNPKVLWEIGWQILDAIRNQMNDESDQRQPCLIGLPTAGTPLAQAAAMVDYKENITKRNAIFYQMRSVRKLSHGAHEKWIIGSPDIVKHRIYRVDNVVTDGGTKFEMAERFTEDGLMTHEIEDIILVDRQQGAVKRMKQKGFKDPLVIFNLLDLTYVFSHLGTWPSDVVDKVKKEIESHQFL